MIIVGALFLCTNNSSQAVEFGAIKYNDAIIDYSSIDKHATLERADYYFNKALSTENDEDKRNYLQIAGGEYFVLTRIEPQNIYYMVQLARVYDMQDNNSFAKGYFFNALKINRTNAGTNYYLGEYYYKRNNYTQALYFYNIAFENGYTENYEILIKMAVMFEKLGDLLRANQYYKKAYILNPQNPKLSAKIKELEQVKYKNTGYYRKQTKGKI